LTSEALKMAKQAYQIESECIQTLASYFDEEAFSKAVELLAKAERIGSSGCGHSGIMCQHFAHLMCCIEQPAKFVSPAEAVQSALARRPCHAFIPAFRAAIPRVKATAKYPNAIGIPSRIPCRYTFILDEFTFL